MSVSPLKHNDTWLFTTHMVDPTPGDKVHMVSNHISRNVSKIYGVEETGYSCFYDEIFMLQYLCKFNEGQNMNYNLLKTISSFSEYLEFVKELNSNNEELWYRGQRNSRWDLEPSIFRGKTLNITDGISSLKYSNIPDFFEVLSEFKNSLKSNVKHNSVDFNDFHYMFLGQHYKLLTPVLDWSTDPLVALFFAIDKYNNEKNVSPLVFILRPNLLNNQSCIVNKDQSPINEVLVIDDLSQEYLHDWLKDMNDTPFDISPFAIKSNIDISHRISRQSGVFTLHGARKRLTHPWIQTSIENTTFGFVIEIAHQAVEEIKQYLNALNITENTIYGKSNTELDDICNEISTNAVRR